MIRHMILHMILHTATTLIGLALLAAPAGAEPMKGRYELRCQDPGTRQWSVSGRITDPEILDRPGGGRDVRGTGADGKPVTLPMPSDRTCLLSATS